MNPYRKGILGEKTAIKLLKTSTSFGKYINDKRAAYDILWLSKSIEVKSSFSYPEWVWQIPWKQYKADFYLFLGFKKDKIRKAFLVPKEKMKFSDNLTKSFTFGKERKYKKTGFPLEKYEISLK